MVHKGFFQAPPLKFKKIFRAPYTILKIEQRLLVGREGAACLRLGDSCLCGSLVKQAIGNFQARGGYGTLI
jgi:hypothetical protein